MSIFQIDKFSMERALDNYLWIVALLILPRFPHIRYMLQHFLTLKLNNSGTLIQVSNRLIQHFIIINSLFIINLGWDVYFQTWSGQANFIPGRTRHVGSHTGTRHEPCRSGPARRHEAARAILCLSRAWVLASPWAAWVMDIYKFPWPSWPASPISCVLGSVPVTWRRFPLNRPAPQILQSPPPPPRSRKPRCNRRLPRRRPRRRHRRARWRSRKARTCST